MAVPPLSCWSVLIVGRPGGDAVIVDFDAIADGLEEGVFLRIPYHEGGTVVDRPHGSADGAAEEVFVEALRIQAHKLSGTKSVRVRETLLSPP